MRAVFQLIELKYKRVWGTDSTEFKLPKKLRFQSLLLRFGEGGEGGGKEENDEEEEEEEDKRSTRRWVKAWTIYLWVCVGLRAR